ncbi:hypothetical protein [Mesorhizobium sp.]|uniref:hypothetical protein n=1 Tax=Mesorhizobium sp. TaxID=1871066 RepID=UPI000FE7BC54|nr:hypothetical protein [Mesorhizobium sp.]RWQ14816.1 MAG: hypothetical protein EOR93_27930 [Mesorhizobium sp.]
MASIIHDAALSAREDPTKRISYSRRKVFYAAAGRYYGTDYGYDTVVPAVDALVASGLLVEHDKVKGGPAGTGIQSSFLPGPRLAEITLPKVERRAGELIRLKDADGNLVGYRDTERTVRDRKFLEAVNTHIAAAEIRLHGINGAVVNEDEGTIFFPGFMSGFDGGEGDHTVYISMKGLYRVYNGGWTLGGRLYGGWWQQVRSRDRQHFVIDGGATCEVDYEMLHPRLVYAAAGRKLDGDAYTLDGWDRQVCKRAFNILLNADGYHSALGAILPYVGENRQAAAELIADIKRHHSAVADRFHSGVGLRLQNLDSEMAKSVLHELTVRQGITVLPVHDSFIVREDHRADLVDAMDRAFSRAAATVGNRQAVSNGYLEIYPQMEERGGGDDLVQPAADPNPCSAIVSATSLQLDSAKEIPIMPFHTVRPPFPRTGTAGTDIPSVETAFAPGSHHPSQPPETALRASIPGAAFPDAPTPVDAAIAPPEARQCASETPAPPVVKRIYPPAFLNRANWLKVASEELHRIADRPLTDRRTIDHVPRGRRQAPISEGRAGRLCQMSATLSDSDSFCSAPDHPSPAAAPFL